MSVSRAIVLGSLLLITAIAWGQPAFKKAANPDELLAKIKNVSAQTSSIAADFKEEKHLAIFKEPQFTSGKFYHKADKMRWEQSQPFEYIILINGKTVRLRDNGEEKKVNNNNRMFAQVSSFLMDLIKGDYSESNFWEIQCYESSAEYKIVLIPTNKVLGRVYQELNLFFSKEAYRLERIFFAEPSGDYKTMYFANQVYNQELNPALFTEL